MNKEDLKKGYSYLLEFKNKQQVVATYIHHGIFYYNENYTTRCYADFKVVKVLKQI